MALPQSKTPGVSSGGFFLSNVVEDADGQKTDDDNDGDACRHFNQPADGVFSFSCRSPMILSR